MSKKRVTHFAIITLACSALLTNVYGQDAKAAVNNGKDKTALQKMTQPTKNRPLTVFDQLKQKKAKREMLKEKQLEKLMPAILERDRLSIENSLKDAKLNLELSKLKAEISRLKAENEKLLANYTLSLNDQKLKMLQLEKQKQELILKKAIEQLKASEVLAKLMAEKQQLELKNGIIQQKNLAELNAIRAKNEKESLLLAQENKKVATELAKLNLRRLTIHQKLNDEINELSLKNKIFETKKNWEAKVHRPIVYRKNPLDGKTLYISDRRIKLDGVILSETGRYVEERINYYNNKSKEYPIFIVIGECPGGSVLAGERIIKAMESSVAPVYVVVKTFAASMAAVITTRAKYSFAYPNAIILHHQMWGASFGNKTQMEENLKFMSQLEKRIMGPVAKKLGMTLEEFRKQMYKHNSGGDWLEFADNAMKKKWVNSIAAEIHEDAYIQKPTSDLPKPWWSGHFEEKKDESGQRYLKLPRLGPYDYYFIHNPDNYYR